MNFYSLYNFNKVLGVTFPINIFIASNLIKLYILDISDIYNRNNLLLISFLRILI